MNNTLRKISVYALVIATVVSMSGVLSVKPAAAAATEGSLIKMAGLSTVYYFSGGKRYVFPNEKTFKTWYRDFNSVQTISQSELESYPLGGNVTYRPGVRLVKITTNPNVYAVDYNRTLRSIVSEANAISLWGSNWASMVEDVPDAFFTNYVVGAPLTAGMYGAGQLVKKSSSPDVYYFDGTNFRAFSSESAFTANRFSFAHVATAPASMTLTPMGSAISGADNSLLNVSGGASSSASTGTGLAVALSADTPASASLPKGATGVNYSKFNVTASNDGDIVLQSVTVTRTGVGTPADFENVYLYDGMTRLTSGRSVNTSTNKATFSNLNLTVPRGTTKTLTIVADMLAAGTGSGSNALGVSAASDVVAGGATVTGSFPVMGNQMGMSNVTAGTITIERTGSLTDPKAGETGAKVASFKLTAGSAEDLKVTGVTLYNIGNIAADKVSNFVLKQADTTVATAASMSNSNIMLNFTSPYMLEKGASRTFDLYADIGVSARSGDTIIIYLDNNADLHSIGQTYGFGAAVTRTGYDNSAGNWTDSSKTTIQTGQVTIAFQGPAVQDISVQQQDVELFRFTITSQSNIEIRSTDLNLTATSATADDDQNDDESLLNDAVANYTDIKFTDVTSNQLVAGPKDVTAGGNDITQTLTYNDIWNVNAGQTRTIKVTADVANFTPVSDEGIRATLNAFTPATEIKNLDTNQFLATADVVPSTNIVGNNHRVKAGSLTVALAASPSLQTYIHGSTAVGLVGLNLTAGTGKDVKVTSLMLTGTGADDCATLTDCILNMKLWDGATQVGSTESVSGTGTVTFDNLNVTIPKGTTKTLVASADLNTITFTAGTDTIEFDFEANGDLVAQDMDGNSISATGAEMDGPDMVIEETGSLTVALAPDDAETEARIVLAGKTDEVIGRFRLTASKEALKLSRVTIELPANTADEVTSMSLWDGATKVTNDVPVTNAGTPYAKFTTFTSDFVIAKDTTKTLTVKANTAAVGNAVSGEGADSGATITATLATDTTNDDQFEARGVSSNTVLDDDNVTQTAANNMILRKSKMTITENNLATTVLSNGSPQDVYSFTVAADAKGDVAIKQLIFNSIVTDNVGTNDTLTAGTFEIYRNGSNITTNVDIHNLAGATIESTNTLGEGTTQAVVTWASEEIIAAGTSNTYIIRATLSGYATPADDDTFRMHLRADASAQTSGYTYIADADQTASQYTASLGTAANLMMATPGATVTLSGNDNIIWSDNAAIPHDYTLTDNVGAEEGPDTDALDWINGYLLKTQPFNGRTLTN